MLALVLSCFQRKYIISIVDLFFKGINIWRFTIWNPSMSSTTTPSTTTSTATTHTVTTRVSIYSLISYRPEKKKQTVASFCL
jgi:hypothetical protein